MDRNNLYLILSRYISKADAQALIDAARNPENLVAARVAEAIWESLDTEIRDELHKTLDEFEV
jgi:hypothetical protein